jgi:uncharacterized membrane protein YedE/YeeE
MNSWTAALFGGVLIGIAATLLLWLNGRVAGISGIMHGLSPHRPAIARGASRFSRDS